MNRRRWLEVKYEITEEEYQAILREQGGVCYICRRPPGQRRLSVDHDHRIARRYGLRPSIRGLLCFHHNRGLQWFQDNPEYLARAARYLKSPPAQRVLRHRKRRRTATPNSKAE